MNPQLLEMIAHQTGSAPFSVHSIQFYPPSALYLHWHTELEFLVVQEGTLQMKIESETITLCAGEGVLIPPEQLHQAFARECGTFCAFVFAPELIASPLSELRFQKYMGLVQSCSVRKAIKLSRTIGWQAEILKQLQQIFTIPNEQIGENELFIQGAAMKLWHYLYQNDLKKQTVSKRKEVLGRQLSAAISYLHENYDQDITLDILAKLVHLSRGQFCRSFQLLTGCTPFSYLNRRRILQSCLLLSGTEKKISEIATLCGFATVSYFNRKFMEITHTTPSEYRKNQLTYIKE